MFKLSIMHNNKNEAPNLLRVDSSGLVQYRFKEPDCEFEGLRAHLRRTMQDVVHLRSVAFMEGPRGKIRSARGSISATYSEIYWKPNIRAVLW